MPSTPQLIKLHRRSWENRRQTPLLRGGIFLSLLISLIFLGVVFILIVLYTRITVDLPSLDNLPLLLDSQHGLLLTPTRLYDRTGTQIIYTHQNPAIITRQYHFVASEDSKREFHPSFPKSLINATIAVSDPTFWSNPGFDIEGIKENQHNTIAQRLVSDLLLWEETPSLNRGIRERILAAQIIHHFGHEKVIEWYLNSANYGSLAYGADAAAKVYFGKSASELTLIESAILATISESPALNPFSSPQTTLDRAEIVINAMIGQDFISPQEAETALNTDVIFQEPIESQDPSTHQFINLVWEQLPDSIPLDWIERGGFSIKTSMDYDLQTQVNCTIQVHLSRLTREVNNQRENNDITTNTETCPASSLLPTLTVSPDANYPDINADVVVYDQSNGEILAMAFGPDENHSFFLSEGRPPGTLITPFIYLTAFTRGFNPASLLWDIPIEPSPIPLSNFEAGYNFKGPLRLRNAFATDTLFPAARLINQIGIENIIKIARQMGLSSIAIDPTKGSPDACSGCQILLGEGQIKLVEVVQAFGAFSNQGYLVGVPKEGNGIQDSYQFSPVTILSITDETSRTWLSEPQINTTPVISNQLAYLITDILSDESARWPLLSHPNPLEIGRPAGAKIGTSTNTTDLWTVGYTPQMVVGVWMGNGDNSKANRPPASFASSLWHAIIQYAMRDHPAKSWEVPPGISTIDICDPSGMLPTQECPTIVSEVFLTGQEPTQLDTLYQVFQVNRETGRLATVFSPPELIEERVYLNIPFEARSWAESIGLETPPETYDPVSSPTLNPDIAITSPEMFAYLRGIVTIEGRAAGKGFESYRLQAGKGINPSGWFVIKEETFNQVPSGILGTWDTTGKNGLHAIQLIILRENQRVDTLTIQVTLDNEPPSINIKYPRNLDVLSGKTNKIITFLVDVEDNLGLSHVAYYLNNKLVATQIQPPYAYPWNSKTGNWTLTVKAIDNGGNITENEISFRVE